MNFLIDTNIIIPLEPANTIDLGVNTDLAINFHKLISASQNKLFIHPSIHEDIKRDRVEARKKLRQILLNKYQYLDKPPPISILDPVIVGEPEIGSNNWVDNSLLAAIKGDLVDYLVTEDIGIHKKAKRLNIDSRVLLLVDAIEMIKDLFDKTPSPPPTVKNKFVYEVDSNDQIFNSLRYDYPGFDEWLVKCKRSQRRAYVVNPANKNMIAAIVILKREDRLPNGTEGKILKICTFKVSPDYGGNKIGELLLKTLFDYLAVNNYEFAYFTTYEKQEHLIEFVKDFGFYKIQNYHSKGEIALCKSLNYTEEDIESYSSFDFHLKFGPRVTSFKGNKTFIIPIKPVYHKILFPEFEKQMMFFPNIQPCGNSIRKAYLCHSASIKIKRGDNIIFYRSNDLKAVTYLGIVEDTYRSDKANEIVQYVGKRTVYTYSDISDMCFKPVLAVKFRVVCPFPDAISLRKLKHNNILKGQPQSITQFSSESAEWIKHQLAM